MKVEEIIGEDGAKKFRAEIAIKFYTDQFGKKWMYWGDKTEVEMGEWVESVYAETRNAEFKAKLLIVGGIAATLVIGYSSYIVSKKVSQWHENRRNVGRWEEERKQELRRQRVADEIVIYDYEKESVIEAPRLTGYEVKFEKV